MGATRLVWGVALWMGLGAVALAAPKDDARRHFLAGLEAARAENFEEALDHFLAAQAAYPHPATLYNIARAYGDLGDLEQAIAYYELYAEAAPEKAEEVEPVIRVLRARLNQQRPETPTGGGSDTATAGAVSSAELDRLRAIAAELAAISDDLAQRATAPPVEDGGGEDGGGEDGGGGEDAGAPGGEDFLSEAYERVVVTASRYGQSPLDSPSTISVITAQDIRMSGATSLPDLLRWAVGVEVMSLSAAQPDVSIRGFNRELSNKVLLLIDGRLAYWDLLATPLWATLTIPLDQIERVEITRGPGSALYGANAVTGVVNIITRLPGEGENLVHIDAGQPGYRQGTVMVTGREKRTSYRLSGGWHSTGRWSTVADPDTYPAIQLLGEDDDTSLDQRRADGRIDRAFLDRGLFSISGGYAEGSSEFYSIGGLGNYLLKDMQTGYVRADVGWQPVLLRVYFNRLDAIAGAWYDYSAAKLVSTTLVNDVLDVELSGVFEGDTGAVHHTLSAGGNYRRKQIAWTYLEGDGAPIIENHFGAFVQEDARLGALSFSGALRMDRHPLVDISRTISPRGALVWHLQDTTSLRLTSGTSFRSPSFTESYLELEQPNANPPDGIYVLSAGNRELVPERIFTTELGLRDESSNIHTADATLYVNRVSSLIGLTDLIPSVSFYDEQDNGFLVGTTGFVNEESLYTSYGSELEGHLFPINGLDLRANAHLQRTTEDTGGEVVQDASASALKLNASAAYVTPFRVDLFVGVHYASRQVWRLREFSPVGTLIISEEEIPARTIPSARVAVRPLPDGSLELAATVWNPAALTASGRFREHPKGQLVGGRAYASLIYRF